MTRIAAVLLATLCFTGCKLIDQRTFAPSPEAKAQPAPPLPAVAIDARTPLVVIDSVLPDMADATAGQERATGVMRAMMRDRVPADRIHLGLRTDPALTATQVRVYVR